MVFSSKQTISLFLMDRRWNGFTLVIAKKKKRRHLVAWPEQILHSHHEYRSTGTRLLAVIGLLFIKNILNMTDLMCDPFKVCQMTKKIWIGLRKGPMQNPFIVSKTRNLTMTLAWKAKLVCYQLKLNRVSSTITHRLCDIAYAFSENLQWRIRQRQNFPFWFWSKFFKLGCLSYVNHR